MRRPILTTLTALALGSAGTAVNAAEFIWSDSPAGQVSPYRSSLPFGEMQSRLTFGIDRYRALQSDFLLDTMGADERPAAESSSKLQLYSGFTVEKSPTLRTWRPGPLESPSEPAVGRLSAMGAAWSQQLNPVDRVGVSAGYAQFAHPDAGQDMLDTHAAMSWTSKWSRGWRPGVTGSVFLGDETARESDVRGLGRRYFGFSVGGEVTVFDRHTPYVNYRLQRSLLETSPETLAGDGRAADHSLLSAGWRWQLQRNFSLQAEATYSLSDNGLDLYNQDRSRVIFGTRFDFR